MEQKKKLIVAIVTMIIIPIMVGLFVNYSYDNIKNHSNANKSGLDIEVNININFN